MPKHDLVRYYIEAQRREGAFGLEESKMLVQLHGMRSLILLIDGVDEAADLKEVVEDWRGGLAWRTGVGGMLGSSHGGLQWGRR
jgi:hypothetical protein